MNHDGHIPNREPPENPQPPAHTDYDKQGKEDDDEEAQYQRKLKEERERLEEELRRSKAAKEQQEEPPPANGSKYWCDPNDKNGYINVVDENNQYHRMSLEDAKNKGFVPPDTTIDDMTHYNNEKDQFLNDIDTSDRNDNRQDRIDSTTYPSGNTLIDQITSNDPEQKQPPTAQESPGSGQSSASLMNQIASNGQEQPPTAQESTESTQSSASLIDQVASNNQKQSPSPEKSSGQAENSEQLAAQESPGSGQSSASLVDQVASNNQEQKQLPVPEKSSGQAENSAQQAAQQSPGSGQSSASLVDQVASNSYARTVGKEMGEEFVRTGEVNLGNTAETARDELPGYVEGEIKSTVLKNLPSDKRPDAEFNALADDLLRDSITVNPLSRIKNQWKSGKDAIAEMLNEFHKKDENGDAVPEQPEGGNIYNQLLKPEIDKIINGFNEIKIDDNKN